MSLVFVELGLVPRQRFQHRNRWPVRRRFVEGQRQDGNLRMSSHLKRVPIGLISLQQHRCGLGSSKADEVLSEAHRHGGCRELPYTSMERFHRRCKTNGPGSTPSPSNAEARIELVESSKD